MRVSHEISLGSSLHRASTDALIHGWKVCPQHMHAHTNFKVFSLPPTKHSPSSLLDLLVTVKEEFTEAEVSSVSSAGFEAWVANAAAISGAAASIGGMIGGLLNSFHAIAQVIGRRL